MPRLISFALTKAQITNKQKTVTRRLGWKNLKAGTELLAVEKAMGLKKGEKIKPLARIKVTAVSQERLVDISPSDCAKEGFPDLTPSEFCQMFCGKIKGVTPDTTVTRIQFTFL